MPQDEVKVYALTTCRWCKKTVRWFTEERDIPTEVVEVDTLKGDEADAAEEEVFKVSGGRRFPVTVINDQVVVGFKPEEFEQHLKGEYQTVGE